jgi:primosomal protein N' (replication factor Y)
MLCPFMLMLILPLALPKRTYTYAVPDSVIDLVMPGVRVEVQFGRRRLYSGLVEKIRNVSGPRLCCKTDCFGAG